MLFSIPAYADLSQDNGNITLSSRAISWGLQFPERDFQLQQERHSPDGKDHYYFFASPKFGLNVSFYIEPARKCVSSKDCRDSYLKLPNPLIVNLQNINSFDLNKFAVVEFLVPELKGMQINQMNMSARYVKDGYWVDMHCRRSDISPGKGAFSPILSSRFP